MPIENVGKHGEMFRLSCSCGASLTIPASLAGKKVRCPKCAAVLTAPTAPSSEAIAAQPPPPPLPAAIPVETPIEKAPIRRPRPRQDSSFERRPRPQATGMSLGMGILLVGIGMGVMAVFLVTGAVVFLLLRVDDAPIAQNAPPHLQHPLAIADPLNQLPPADPPFIPPPDDIPRKQHPAIAVKLVAGKFETPLKFPKNRQPLHFELPAKAGVTYRAQLSQQGLNTMTIVGPGIPRPEGDQWNNDVVFVAKQDAVYTIVITEHGHRNPNFSISVVESNSVLPAKTRTKSATELMPTFRTVKTDKPWLSAAFNARGTEFWMAHTDNTLSRWDAASVSMVSTYKMPRERFSAIGVDSTGRLYGQVFPGEGHVIDRNKLSVGNIAVWDPLPSKDENQTLPAPRQTIPLQGAVKQFLNSPDGKWLHFIDVQNRKLGRIKAGTTTVESLDLSRGASDFTITPDGKTIYCCSRANTIDIVDPTTFKLTRTVRIEPCGPYAAAATNQGVVYLTGDWHHDNSLPWDKTKCYAVDLSKLPPGKDNDPVPVIGFPNSRGLTTSNVMVMPDQRAAVFGGDRMFMAVTVVDRPGLIYSPTSEIDAGGNVVISPDSRLMLNNCGIIMSISR